MERVWEHRGARHYELSGHQDSWPGQPFSSASCGRHNVTDNTLQPLLHHCSVIPELDLFDTAVTVVAIFALVSYRHLTLLSLGGRLGDRHLFTTEDAELHSLHIDGVFSARYIVELTYRLPALRELAVNTHEDLRDLEALVNPRVSLRSRCDFELNLRWPWRGNVSRELHLREESGRSKGGVVLGACRWLLTPSVSSLTSTSPIPSIVISLPTGVSSAAIFNARRSAPSLYT
ncbi:hypothetical protein BDK51DRAFT_42865 [Blyttiomyces helicus]|uniref:Uncharacterized protein n=1 Tax=Blyttiomyces helicus TaxID=388810 RepID=A0A4P9WMD3_9FUNG|nr:hypothetical protein BDK51DRAFT_42865 [Blyttiomyces helicus]|eukprot:RKO93365.1 hypothetical protein BDK51DRAFT_42865 [Blyttiomyces helicus]